MENVAQNTPVLAHVEGSAGILELNRTRQLNAISGEMVDIISEALHQWADDDAITHVVLFTKGMKVFCAGGDIRAVRDDAAEGKHERGDHYLTREYRLNLQIADFPKPYVSFIDGSVLGGGIGLAMLGSHRVVTENSLAAMPEMAIGWVPDVGTTYFMAHMVGELGRPIPALASFVGLTSYPMSPADMLFTGLATHFVPSIALDKAIDAVIQEGPVALERFATDFAQESHVRKYLPLIEDIFGRETWPEIDAAIGGAPDAAFRESIRDLMHAASPTAIVAATETYAANRKAQSLQEGINNEYLIGELLRRDPNFHEGVRAVLIDKDAKPAFTPANALEVDPEPYRAAIANARQIV
ncbi:putative enoyl-CoA hydratase [Corynebacterium kalinowskii]|uniref:3-hydroxyisobutyryl-CoA hydrolase n=1 Tax=Corynebacterium kalinowskii TaxID=2675216 RepID=A0A6B8VRK5_9CORY|nr:3-hydroxyisobutyryl-CoA hydrolase [Corynebacterium kalinowskii]QGU02501.1 putative enoyl-CoA hydratase [Corynebacterium kalinowskii]